MPIKRTRAVCPFSCTSIVSPSTTLTTFALGRLAGIRGDWIPDEPGAAVGGAAVGRADVTAGLSVPKATVIGMLPQPETITPINNSTTAYRRIHFSPTRRQS